MPKATLGDIEFSVVSKENKNLKVNATEKPVEKGQDISDHVKKKPTILTLDGIIVGENAQINMEQLEKYQQEGEVLTYVGRNILDNVVIESFTEITDSSIANGFKFNMTIKQIRIAESQTVEIQQPVVKRQTKPVTNKGRQQPTETTGIDYIEAETDFIERLKSNNDPVPFLTPEQKAVKNIKEGNYIDVSAIDIYKSISG
ncbi:phage baseplate protein [Dethiothermospora halolimnae]|uniref:phage baseplate protein n=1 Tax=Dethiothermospora halolimnae TaxID=3114390 RepID=UPI003CCC280A